MAGISCCFWQDGNDEINELTSCLDLISKRGQDRYWTQKVCSSNRFLWEGRWGATASSVYKSQAKEKNPNTDDKGNVLACTGRHFSVSLNERCSLIPETISNILSKRQDVVQTLAKVQGPYSIIYFDRKEQNLYFARDCMGRRSLVMHYSKKQLIVSSSMRFSQKETIEVPVLGIFVFNFTTSILACHPWQHNVKYLKETVDNLKHRLGIHVEVLEPVCSLGKKERSNKRHPDIGDLCYEEIIAAVTMKKNREVARIEEENLNTVSAEKINSVIESSEITKADLETVEIVQSEKTMSDTGESEKKTEVSDAEKTTPEVLKTENVERIMKSLSDRPEIQNRIQQVRLLLEESIRQRLDVLQDCCKKCAMDPVPWNKASECGHIALRILFSGGIDSTILATLANKCFPEHQVIELVNVAFGKETPSDARANWADVPDRIRGQQAVLELKKLCPRRRWNFIEYDISDWEVQEFRSTRLADFCDPLAMNDDAKHLSCALWFASRKTQPDDYFHAILSGIGADELFGGYGKHRLTLQRGGWPALTDELDSELQKLSNEIMGTIERVLSDSGSQPLFPYLDENFVEYVSGLNAWERCFPTEAMPEGLGDKLLLRLVAHNLGLFKTAIAPHVPIQIGSGICSIPTNGAANENHTG